MNEDNDVITKLQLLVGKTLTGKQINKWKISGYKSIGWKMCGPVNTIIVGDV